VRALRYRFFFQRRFPPFGSVLQIPRVRVVVTDLLLSIYDRTTSSSITIIISDAKNARRYHRGRRCDDVLLLLLLFQQFQLSAQARRLRELMEKLSHYIGCNFNSACEPFLPITRDENKKKTHFFTQTEKRGGTLYVRDGARAQVSLSLTLSVLSLSVSLSLFFSNELFFFPIEGFLSLLGFQHF